MLSGGLLHNASMTPREQQRLSRAVWFELPALDLDRAIRFYETILDTKLQRLTEDGVEFAMFPCSPPSITGCVIKSDRHRPGAGPIVYLNADPKVADVCARVEAAGGKVLSAEVTDVHGTAAWIQDTEGNTVALHSVP